MSLVNKAEPFLIKFRVRLSHRPKLKRIFQSVSLRNLIASVFNVCLFERFRVLLIIHSGIFKILLLKNFFKLIQAKILVFAFPFFSDCFRV